MGKKKGLIVQIAFCFASLCLCLIAYLEKQNEVTELRLAIPRLEREIKSIEDENIRLLYQIQSFERPDHLMELSFEKEFSHLKYPLEKEILVLEGDFALQWAGREKKEEGDLFSSGVK